MSLDQLLKDALLGEHDEQEMMPIADQRTRLVKFLAVTPDHKLKRGDYVKLNKLFGDRYTYPREGQLALVTRVFDEPMLDDNGMFASGEVTVCQHDGSVVPYIVDLRFYEHDKQGAKTH